MVWLERLGVVSLPGWAVDVGVKCVVVGVVDVVVWLEWLVVGVLVKNSVVWLDCFKSGVLGRSVGWLDGLTLETFPVVLSVRVVVRLVSVRGVRGLTPESTTGTICLSEILKVDKVSFFKDTFRSD